MDAAKISFIGAGNVATHLAQRAAQNFQIQDIYSRNLSQASRLANLVPGSKAIDRLDALSKDSDYYIVAVSDDSITEVTHAMPEVKGIVAHTSGSIPLNAIDSRLADRAVLYPLQTFSKDILVDVSQVPFFTEASNTPTLSKIDLLATALGSSVTHADSKLRAQLHLAAVFACNFSNHMYTIAECILKQADLDFSVMAPLLRTTLEKSIANGPAKAQTGPARRGDIHVLEQQASALSPDLKEIYKIISQSIINQYKP